MVALVACVQIVLQFGTHVTTVPQQAGNTDCEVWPILYYNWINVVEIHLGPHHRNQLYGCSPMFMIHDWNDGLLCDGWADQLVSLIALVSLQWEMWGLGMYVNVWTYICVYIHIHVCGCVCICAYTYTGMEECVCRYMHMYMVGYLFLFFGFTYMARVIQTTWTGFLWSPVYTALIYVEDRTFILC